MYEKHVLKLDISIHLNEWGFLVLFIQVFIGQVILQCQWGILMMISLLMCPPSHCILNLTLLQSNSTKIACTDGQTVQQSVKVCVRVDWQPEVLACGKFLLQKLLDPLFILKRGNFRGWLAEWECSWMAFARF